MKKQLKADLMLLIVTIFWGASYLLTKIVLDDIQEFNLIALRFIIAFLLSFIVFHKRLLKVDFKTIKHSIILSSILFGVFVAMNFGIKYTSITNAGFLASLTVIFIPILSSIFLKQIPEMELVIGICFAVIGIGLLTLNGTFKISSGDLLCILSALLYAIHIIVTGKMTAGVDSISLGVFQLGFVGIYSMIFSIFIESPKLPSTPNCWYATLILSILCTAAAFIIQTTSQQYTTATHTGLIFSLEPVFSSIVAFIFAGEILPLKGYLGAALLLLGVLVAELDLKSLFNIPCKESTD